VSDDKARSLLERCAAELRHAAWCCHYRHDGERVLIPLVGDRIRHTFKPCHHEPGMCTKYRDPYDRCHEKGCGESAEYHNTGNTE
jgi:hypothetical protein